MLCRRSAGAVLFVSFLMLSGLAAADEGELFKAAGEGLTAASFDLALSVSAPGAFENRRNDGIPFSGSFSQPASWTLAVLARGTREYLLTAVQTGTGASGFAGVALRSGTATRAGYFGSPIVLTSNPVPTSFVPEPSAASFLITGVFFAFGIRQRRVLAC